MKPIIRSLLQVFLATLILAILVQAAPHPHPLSLTPSRPSPPSPSSLLQTWTRALLEFDTSLELPFMKDYSEFQISDGRGGTAEEEAALVFIQPFAGIDLASIPYEVFDKLKLAKEVTEDMEVEIFEPAIAQADEDTPTGQALKVGMWKNRVLFATADVQLLEIEAAHNKAMGMIDPYEKSDLEYARGYLAWTIEADRDNDGEKSLGVT